MISNFLDDKTVLYIFVYVFVIIIDEDFSLEEEEEEGILDQTTHILIYTKQILRR